MTTTVKAKCPGCGDEDVSLTSAEHLHGESDTEWYCKCGGGFKISDWLRGGEHRSLTDADVEAIARRVVEMMREGA